ncbi:MAG TPA: hypothetical protein VHC63_01940 [Acidimicrobiales bacterium]|nr:hypothetical protein [Acidimicrobiales bacterium]
MSRTPNPERLDVYEAKLAELIAERNTAATQRKDRRVYALNRQIEAQRRWIKRARSVSP